MMLTLLLQGKQLTSGCHPDDVRCWMMLEQPREAFVAVVQSLSRV